MTSSSVKPPLKAAIEQWQKHLYEIYESQKTLSAAEVWIALRDICLDTGTEFCNLPGLLQELLADAKDRTIAGDPNQFELLELMAIVKKSL